MTNSFLSRTKAMSGMVVLTGVISSIAGCGLNTVESNNHRIMSRWCGEQGGEFRTEKRGFPYSPDRCVIPVTKGKANIVVGSKTIPFKARVVNYDTGEREVIALTERDWVPSKTSGNYGRGHYNYKEVKIGSYVLTDAPEN